MLSVKHQIWSRSTYHLLRPLKSASCNVYRTCCQLTFQYKQNTASGATYKSRSEVL